MSTSISRAKVQDSIIQCFSPKHEDDMSDEDEGWQGNGAFPRRRSPLSTSGEAAHHIFVDEAFDGPYESLAVVNEDSRDTASSSQDGLMAISHSSSDTPAINNTAAAVRDALKKQSKLQSPASDSKGTGFYPFNVYQSLSREMEVERKAKNIPKEEEKRESSRKSQAKVQDNHSTLNHSILPPTSMEDENSSAITEDHQDLSLPPPMSVMSTRSRRHGGGSKQHLIRHTLASTQQINANPGHMLKNLFINIEQERQMHKLTAQHLRAIHNWLLFLPSILLTLCAGVMVLVFEAELSWGEDVRVYSSIAVGVISLISVFWQALCKQLDLGVHGALHATAAIALKRLSEDILLTLSATDTIPAEYVALIGEKFGQAIDACPSNIPYQLEAAFSALSDRMILIFRPPMSGTRTHVQKLDYIRLYATAYDELSAEIIDCVWFPFAFPNPRNASDAALCNFKSIITEGREVDRSRCFRKWICPCFTSADEERSLFDVLPLASQIDSAGNGSPHYPIRNYMLGTDI
ncbi:hypothetical protein IV203_034623 [Nitzschia inconspicua]|uniref:Uncharacterized protein n=1 Tax=Nitzschia inconspicua TaxID=303405 RepID=A0A9K3LBR2_9STRA|nr:hypothetical protein IV203_002709 [Nitzschia inconspicua]KAG7359525.1 hypothetical protein IV203_034623 [Nitzschia inconspicua]